MNKVKEVLLILGAGAVGGLVSVIDAWQDPVSFPLTMAKFASLFFVPVVKGGLAAGIGVYLLTTVDSTQIVKTCFFAVTCGLAFPSILSNAGGYAQSVTSQVASKQVAQSASEIKAIALSPDESPEALNAKRETIEVASQNIIKAAAKSAPAEVGLADTTLQQAVGDLGKVAATDPSSIDTIEKIGAAAASQNLSLTRQASFQQLTAIRDSPKTNPQLKDKASLALKRLGAVSGR